MVDHVVMMGNIILILKEWHSIHIGIRLLCLLLLSYCSIRKVGEPTLCLHHKDKDPCDCVLLGVRLHLTCQSVVDLVVAGPQPEHGLGQCPHAAQAVLGHGDKVLRACTAAEELLDIVPDGLQHLLGRCTEKKRKTQTQESAQSVISQQNTTSWFNVEDLLWLQPHVISVWTWL